jgi:RHS repeat-associated protein
VYDTNWNATTETWDAGLCFTPADPEYDTRNNRLLEYREYPGDGEGGWLAADRSVRYTYYKIGHVSNITVKDYGEGAAYDWYNDLALYYTSDGKLWRVLWDRWKVVDESVTNYEKLAAREFYYDGPSRYLTREVDPDTWAPVAAGQLWTDQTGLLPWGDFTTDGSYNVVESERYLAGAGVHAQQTLGGLDPIRYLHGDLIDSTMLTTDGDGTYATRLSYTAFGEPIGDPAALGTRYQYAGGYGYESGLLTLPGATGTKPITLQHVGWRWYDPGSGRFVQRDPAGITAGLNVYAYCGSDPATGVDPLGLHDGGPSHWGRTPEGELAPRPYWPKPQPSRLTPERPIWRPGNAQSVPEGEAEVAAVSMAVGGLSWLGGPITGVPTCIIVGVWNVVHHALNVQGGLYD